jgi:hypothetical protein
MRMTGFRSRPEKRFTVGGATCEAKIKAHVKAKAGDDSADRMSAARRRTWR